MTTASSAFTPPAAPHSNAVDWLLLVLPGTIWGASFLFIAEGLESLDPGGVTFLRIAIGFVTLSLLPGARRRVRREDRTRIALLGIIWLAFPLTMFPFAERHVSSALTGMLNGATPLFAAAVASGLERRFPSRAAAIGLAVGFAGTVLIAWPGIGQDSGDPGQTTGVVLILAALTSYGFAINLTRPLQQRNGALPVVHRALAFALLLTAPLGIPALIHARWAFGPIACVVALGAGGTGVAYVLLAVAAERVGATRASSTNFLVPVVALMLGLAMRGEQVAAISVVGAGVCLAGAWMIRRASLAAAR